MGSIATYVQGITKPLLTAKVDFNLTGWTVELHLWRSRSTKLVKTCTITDAPAGEVECQWATGDLVAGENQPVQLRLTKDGDVHHYDLGTISVTHT